MFFNCTKIPLNGFSYKLRKFQGMFIGGKPLYRKYENFDFDGCPSSIVLFKEIFSWIKMIKN
jgi:hypothetical protein